MPPDFGFDPEAGDALPSGQTPQVTPQDTPQDAPQVPPATPEPAPSQFSDAHSALDALLKTRQTPQPDPKPEPEPEPEPKPEPDPKPEPGPEDVDTVQFPQNSSVKARESFEKLKQLSKERVIAAETKAKAVADELAALKDKLAGKSPDELQQQTAAMQKELEELRAFRKSVDVESSPEFKAYDDRVARNDDAIFAKLKEWGWTDEHVKKAREYGTDKLNWDPILEKLTSTQRRFIEAKLVDNESAVLEKSSALEAAKKDADRFLSDREIKQKEAEAQKANARNEVARRLEAGADWLKDPEIPKDASAEDKERIQGARKFLAGLRSKIQVAIEDTSPEMHATLAYGNAMSFYLSAHADYLAKQLETAKKQVAGLQGEITKIKKAGSGKTPLEPGLESNARAT
jgi:hypothetical protein